MQRRLPTASITHLPGIRGTRVAVIEPAAVEREALAFMGYGGWTSRFELQRFALLAERWRTRIVVPEVPGCSARPTRVSARQAVALARGDFRRLAGDMIRGAAPALSRPGPTLLVGYSMGASLASAALAVASRAELVATHIVLVEPVAIQRWSPTALIRATEAEDALAGQYVTETMAWEGAVLPPEDDAQAQPHHRDRLSMTLLGNALRHERLRVDLRAGLAERPEASVAIVRGEQSLLCPPKAALQLAHVIRQQGTAVTDIALAGSHPLWHSLDQVSTLATRVKASWS